MLQKNKLRTWCAALFVDENVCAAVPLFWIVPDGSNVRSWYPQYNTDEKINAAVANFEAPDQNNATWKTYPIKIIGKVEGYDCLIRARQKCKNSLENDEYDNINSSEVESRKILAKRKVCKDIFSSGEESSDVGKAKLPKLPTPPTKKTSNLGENLIATKPTAKSLKPPTIPSKTVNLVKNKIAVSKKQIRRPTSIIKEEFKKKKKHVKPIKTKGLQKPCMTKGRKRSLDLSITDRLLKLKGKQDEETDHLSICAESIPSSPEIIVPSTEHYSRPSMVDHKSKSRSPSPRHRSKTRSLSSRSPVEQSPKNHSLYRRHTSTSPAEPSSKNRSPYRRYTSTSHAEPSSKIRSPYRRHTSTSPAEPSSKNRSPYRRHTSTSPAEPSSKNRSPYRRHTSTSPAEPSSKNRSPYRRHISTSPAEPSSKNRSPYRRHTSASPAEPSSKIRSPYRRHTSTSPAEPSSKIRSPYRKHTSTSPAEPSSKNRSPYRRHTSASHAEPSSKNRSPYRRHTSTSPAEPSSKFRSPYRRHTSTSPAEPSSKIRSPYRRHTSASHAEPSSKIRSPDRRHTSKSQAEPSSKNRSPHKRHASSPAAKTPRSHLVLQRKEFCSPDELKKKLNASAPGQDFKDAMIYSLVKIATELERQREMVSAIFKIVVVNPPHVNEHTLSKDVLVDPMYPLDTEDQLRKVEEQLKSDKIFKSKLIKEMSMIGGATTNEITKRILRRIMSDNLAAKFSWVGFKKKLVFSKLVLKDVLFAAVRSNRVTANSSTEYEVETAVKDWLRHAPHRAKKNIQEDAEESPSTE